VKTVTLKRRREEVATGTNERKTPTVKMAEHQSTRDTIVNINEGPENLEESTETQLSSVQENLLGVCGGIPLTMDLMLDQASPPPPYQEHNDFYQSPPSAPTTHPMLPSSQVPPSRCSPPPSYSQIDLANHHLPSATSHLGRPSSHIPSQLRSGGTRSHLGGTTSQLGGARPKTQQQTNQQQMRKKQMTHGQAGVTNGQRIGYEWLQMVSNGQRILNVRPKVVEEEGEMSGRGKVGVATGIFTFVLFFLYLILPYSPFSP